MKIKDLRIHSIAMADPEYRSAGQGRRTGRGWGLKTTGSPETGSSGSLAVWSRLMANIGTTSWSAPLPESLEETWVEFPTGLGARPDCGEEPIVIAVPKGTTIPMQSACGTNVFGEFGDPYALYFGGDMNACIALAGQAVGRIDTIRPVADIIADTVREFGEVIDRLAGRS